MTESGQEYKLTGRYLGVSGYFLYGENTNWVYCHCKKCWVKEIKKLPCLENADEVNHGVKCRSCSR